jgi:uncharacterized protein (TIGR04562 family)
MFLFNMKVNVMDKAMAKEDVLDLKKMQLDKWSFYWPIMNVLIGGRSSIDLPEINMRTHEEAHRFIRSYGYDPDRVHDARLIHATIIEALGFIERNLMPKEWKQGVMPPLEIIACQDVRDLLVWASDRSAEQHQRRIWACAVLRVMHTIAHIEGAFRYSEIDSARDEIMARFQSITRYLEEGIWFVYGDHKLRLHKLEWKTQKTRESILLKLLHKRANVAETIYDMIGLRIVTVHQADVMQVVKMLYLSHVISFPNAIPSRSRNSIIDPDSFHSRVEGIRGELATGKINLEIFERAISHMRVDPPASDKENVHSGDDYQAIQLTCRQLIRTPRPLTVLRKNLEAAADESLSHSSFAPYLQEMAAVLKNIARMSGDDEFAFFPYEVQVMDMKAWENNSVGKASHGKYKKSQVRAARRRILNEILPLTGQQGPL